MLNSAIFLSFFAIFRSVFPHLALLGNLLIQLLKACRDGLADSSAVRFRTLSLIAQR